MPSRRLSWSDWTLLSILAAFVAIAIVYIPFGWKPFRLMFSSEAAAAWAQALGSFVGLIVAIGLPLRLRVQEIKDRREHERAVAHVTAAGVALTVNPILGCLSAFASRLQSHNRANGPIDHRFEYIQFANLKLPPDQQFHALEPIDRDLAVLLARGTSHVEQIRTALLTLRVSGNATDFSELVLALLPSAQIAHAQFTAAAQKLNDFVDSVESI